VTALIVVATNLFQGRAPFKPTQKATIAKHSFKVKVAESEGEKEIGLSQTRKMPNNYAMIFPFGKDGYYSFWMRNMKFPIDIIYINNNKIVKIFPNVNPPKNNEPLRVYVSDNPSDTVLEINGGLSEKYKFKQGDAIALQKI